MFFIFLLIYLAYHTFNGRYNIQNYLINKFELKLFQDFHYNLKQKTLAIDMDLNALRNESDDFLDELSKQFSEPENGEILFKLD
jgi:cell division protein FtsB